MTRAWWELWGKQPLHVVLSHVLVTWDYLDEHGDPIQPHPLDDKDYWTEQVRKTRCVVALAEKQERLRQAVQAALDAPKVTDPTTDTDSPDSAAQDGAGNVTAADALTPDEEAEALKQPITEDERLLVYQYQWQLILIMVDDVFLDACLTAIVEDLRPGKRRGAASGAGSSAGA